MGLFFVMRIIGKTGSETEGSPRNKKKTIKNNSLVKTAQYSVENELSLRGMK